MLHYSDYLREEAEEYRQLAESAEGAEVNKQFLELAARLQTISATGEPVDS
jgi:hypothetical protein